MQHACRKQNAMLQRAKIRRLRHTPAIMARDDARALRATGRGGQNARETRRRGQAGGAGGRYLSSP
jgi:hypothetical protein